MIATLVLTLGLTTVTATAPPLSTAPEAEQPPLAALFEEPTPAASSNCTYPLTGSACTVTCPSGAILTCGPDFQGACNVCPGVLLTCNRYIQFCFDT